jgi:serine/threonine protein kinase
MIPDKLTIISKISDEGNFGEVHLCENTYLANRKEAVKYIRIQNEEEEARIAEIKKNLFESSVLEYLRKCKYIVEIYDAEILKDGFRINMEYLERGSVQKLLNEKTFLGAKQILKISECVLNALEYAHRKGILHLDVKPGNILVKNETTFKLSDFGLSNIRDQEGNSSFKQIYTMHVPPEAMVSVQSKATVQSDIYMFGVTLYRLLNGDSHLANQRDRLREKSLLETAIISGKFPARSSYFPHVNKKLIKIVNKCLAVDLNKRYKNVRDVRIDLGKVRVRHNWTPKVISDSHLCWECCVDGIPHLEVIGEKNETGLWNFSLLKYGKTRKTKVSKHCAGKLKEKDFYKKFSAVFQEYL